MNLRRTRQMAGISQLLTARESGIARARLSLAETGQLTLRPEETLAIRRILHRALAAKRVALEVAFVATS